MVAPVAAAPPRGPRFRPIRRLGSGGFGRVWLAHDNKLGHVVALKAAHAPDAETEKRLEREARALAAVRHPNCVRIYDLVPARSDPGLSDLDGMVIVMGYVDGLSLGDLVRDHGVLDDVAAARVWVNLAGALDAAHSRGVMHRDVKPGNVVVDPHGVAHLIDFGIARKSGDATMTQTGFVLGTPDFLAPEIACGERASAASDSWQLAATISLRPHRAPAPRRARRRGLRPARRRHRRGAHPPAPAHGPPGVAAGGDGQRPGAPATAARCPARPGRAGCAAPPPRPRPACAAAGRGSASPGTDREHDRQPEARQRDPHPQRPSAAGGGPRRARAGSPRARPRPAAARPTSRPARTRRTRPPRPRSTRPSSTFLIALPCSSETGSATSSNASSITPAAAPKYPP